MNFLDFDHSFGEAKFIIIPSKIGGTSVGSKGAEEAPDHIIKASWQIEDWDTELKFDFTESKFHTFKPVRNLEELYEASLFVLKHNKIPVVIGGEHFISHVVLRAMKEVLGEVSVIFFDAHADMFDEFNGNKFSHACALFLSLPYIKDFVSIGVRNVAKREVDIINNLGLKDKFLFFEDFVYVDRKEGCVKMNLDLLDQKIESLKGAFIYLSFDYDFIDPGYLPSLSTPEPPGFSFVQTLFIIRRIIEHFGQKIRGFDFVEFCPQGIFASDVSAAKIIAKSLSYLAYTYIKDEK
ncbi:MAG: arginase family protein [Candidatus Calescibacterium sp.]|nr:arginase family protein [Candidatus Calescibacterium sp.]MCX7733428.1 arginase family protein [bacterium]MDW8087545.1 arginase family protein [Candidatus Calescibacterium sp.]